MHHVLRRLRTASRAKLIALAVTLVAFVAGCVVIVAEGASAAYLGTLMVGCTALGTFLATVLDRRT